MCERRIKKSKAFAHKIVNGVVVVTVRLEIVLIILCHLFTVHNRYEIVSKELINRFISLWTCKQFAPFVVTSLENENDGETKTDIHSSEADSENDLAIINECRHDGNYLFSMLLTPAAVLAQQHRPRQSFIILADLLTALIKNDLMTISFINKQCVKLLRHEWAQVSIRFEFAAH